jgi:hypothetical protein
LTKEQALVLVFWENISVRNNERDDPHRRQIVLTDYGAEHLTLNNGFDYPANRFGRSQRRYSPARINLHKGWTVPPFFIDYVLNHSYYFGSGVKSYLCNYRTLS